MRVGIIDLGANSFHLVIYDVLSRGKYIPLKRRSYVNSLGSFLSINPRIPSSEIKKSAGSVDSLCRYARLNKVNCIKIFGTSIFRRARNSMQLIDAIFRKTGLVVDVLSEDDEVKIIFGAVKNKYELKSNSLIIDIGGGSSEFIIARGKKIKWAKSIPSGVAYIREELKKSKTIGIKWFRANIFSNYKGVISYLAKKKFDACYGTCGFLRYFAFEYKKEEMKGNKNFEKPIPLNIKEIKDVLISSKPNIHDMDVNKRENIVYAGSFVLSYIMDKLRVKEILVSSASSREGYLLKLMRKNLTLCC